MILLQKRIQRIIEHKEIMNIDIDDRNELIEVYHVLEYQISLNLLFEFYNMAVCRKFVEKLERELR